MKNLERFKLVPKELVSDKSLVIFRILMASLWYLEDLDKQKNYIDMPNKAPHGDIIQSLCLMLEKTVVGTAGIYDISKPNKSSDLKNKNGKLLHLPNFPKWLSSFSYLGDISLSPDYQKQGLASELVNFVIEKIGEGKTTIGITEKKNDGMKGIIERTGGHFPKEGKYFFAKASEETRPEIYPQDLDSVTCKPIYLDTNYPPVANMFYSKSNKLLATSIAALPNHPNTNHSSPDGSEDLFYKQCVVMINPELSPEQIRGLGLLEHIYWRIGRFKYVNIFQYQPKGNIELPHSGLIDGHESDWIIYEYAQKNFSQESI